MYHHLIIHLFGQGELQSALKSYPLTNTLMSTLFLGEYAEGWRWAAVVAWFCGHIITTRLGAIFLDLNTLLPIFSTLRNVTFNSLTRSAAHLLFAEAIVI